jgi:hypothetical protein
MAKFTKGNKIATGRPKGVMNKRTSQWETFSEYLLNGGLVRFQEELDKLKGKDYTNTVIALLEYHKPKLARTEITGNEGEELIPKTITIEIVTK